MNKLVLLHALIHFARSPDSAGWGPWALTGSVSDTKLRPVLRATPLGVESCYGVIAVPKKHKRAWLRRMRQRGESVLGCASVCETQQDTQASNKTNHFVNEISRKLIIYPLPCHCFRQSSTAGVRKLSCHLLPVNNRKYREQVLQGGAARLLLLLLEFLVQCWPWWIDSSAAFLSLPHDKIRWALWVDLWTLIRLSLAENTISRAAPMRFYRRIFLPFSKILPTGPEKVHHHALLPPLIAPLCLSVSFFPCCNTR